MLEKIEAIGKAIEHGFVAVFHAVEHEVPAILSLLVNIYGKEAIATAIATHVAGVKDYADKGIEVADADVKALVQSTMVERFGLPPTAAQFVSSGIHHLVTVGEDKINALIDQGAAAAIAATADTTAATPTP